MRTVSSEVQDVLTGPVVPAVLLLSMEFDSGTMHVCTSSRNITHEGTTWLAMGGVGHVEQIADAARETPSLRLSLTGVPNTQIAMALAEPVRNRPLQVYIAHLSPGAHSVLDVALIWSGTLDQMTVRHAADGSVTIGVTAEHAGATLARPKPLRYTDADQRRLYPGDTCLRFLPSQANHQDVWPAASWGRK